MIHTIEVKSSMGVATRCNRAVAGRQEVGDLGDQNYQQLLNLI